MSAALFVDDGPHSPSQLQGLGFAHEEADEAHGFVADRLERFGGLAPGRRQHVDNPIRAVSEDLARDLFQSFASGKSHKRASIPAIAPTFETFKNASEMLFFQRRLARNDGNVKRTAEELGMQRSHLYKKLDRYGLR